MSFLSDLLNWFRRGKPPVPPPLPPPLPPIGDMIDDLLCSHNEIRLDYSLPSLVQNAELSRAAQGHAQWMADRRILSHNQGTQDFTIRILAQGYTLASAAENIAAGQLTVVDVMRSWMNSPGHKNNILGQYNDVGFGVAKASDGTIYWCVVFANSRG